MNIQENNKLIAEFMEWRHEGSSARGLTGFWNGSGYFTYSELKFHESWDWLMPVVKHCTDLTRNFEFCSEQYLYWQNELFHPDYMLSEFIENDISSIYSRVVEFIKWYNEQDARKSFG